MFRKNARLIPTTEKGGLATPLWSDSEFKSLLGVQMNIIVTEKVRQELTQKYEIHPDKTWSVDECKKVLGACIRKNNVKGIICCHREFGLALATQQSQRNSELEKQNNELRARIYTLTKKLNLKKEAKTDVEVSQPDNIYPDLQAFFETDVALQSVTDVPVNSFNVCGARRRSQGIEETDSVPLNSSVVQIQTVAKALGPKDIERLSQSLPAARTHFSEFRRTLISKMRLYDMSLTEVTQLMSQILTESEFNSFESAVTSELRNASKGDLREGILKILKNILGPKIDWSRITTCVQRKEETVSEYTERFCQSAVIYSGIVDDPESVLDDKGPLVRIWSDGLVAEYRKALPFLDLTWSNRTLRSNLDRLTTWERDADVKAKVRVAAATFNTTKQDNRWSKRESKCKYCEKFGHWEKECRKKLQDSKRNAMHNSAPSQPAHNPEVVPPVTTETLGQLVQALLRAQQDQEKKLIIGAVSSYLSPVIQHNDQRIFVKGSIKEKEIDFLLDTGAEITVIPTKLAQGLNIPYKKTKLCLMVLGQTVNVKCPHAVSALMNQAKVTSVTSSRWGNWLATLTAPNIVIQRAPVTNPSSCMMSAMTEFVLEDEGEMTHDCVTLTYAATSEIAETPIENAELELFVDGSAQVIEGNRRAGYAVTSTTEVVASGRLPDHFSAQAAELVALTRACTLASGSVANIYTDSRYAFGVIHDFGVIWQTRKFLTSAGSPIKHAGLVKDLMFAMKLPKKLAVIKVKAHLTTNTTEAKGNALADVAAKQACFYATVQVCSGSTAQKIILPPESIVDLYKDVPLYEAWTWLDKGATVDSSGCWTKGGKYVAPESLLPYLAQQIHSLGHSGPATMNHRFSNQWWNPKFRNAATETVKRCVTCQKNNDVPAAITPAAHTPAPPGPFRHLQVDYISLPPCKGKTDVLVVIDKFSRWVEAYPTGRATAAHTAKCLVTDFIPRWGLPDCIDSDQGTHFTGQVVKEVSRMLKIKWNLHCPYRPQASGQVERSNRTIKTRLSKMHQEGVPWVEALPAVLCSMRASPNRSVGLSPHEIITGRPMQMPGVIDLRNADVHIASDALIAYCENLTKAVQSAKERVESCWQTPPEGGHTIVPGQWVMIKTFKNKPLEPKWYGPHQVMLITAAAVLCQGRKTWTHVSHIKVVPPPAGIG